MSIYRRYVTYPLANALVGMVVALSINTASAANTPADLAGAIAQDITQSAKAAQNSAALAVQSATVQAADGSGTGAHSQKSASYRINSTTLASFLWSNTTKNSIPAGQIELALFDRNTASATLRALFDCRYDHTEGPHTELVLYSDYYVCPSLGGFVMVSFWADNLLVPFIHYFVVIP